MSYLPMACLLWTNDEKFSKFGDKYDKATVKMPLFYWRFEESKDLFDFWLRERAIKNMQYRVTSMSYLPVAC